MILNLDAKIQSAVLQKMQLVDTNEGYGSINGLITSTHPNDQSERT